MAKNSRNAYGFGQGGPLPPLNPVPIISPRDPVPSDIGFELGTHWINTNANDVWVLTSIIAGTSNWEPIGQDTGGAAPISKYIVDVDGTADYITIQAALDAANAIGIPATVVLRTGTYAENLTLYQNISIFGTGFTDCIITGTHTPPATGNVQLHNCRLNSASNIFISAIAGTANITLSYCETNVANGFTFNLLNWTGTLGATQCGSVGGNDGFVNNTGGASILIHSSRVGDGIANPMLSSGGTVTILSSEVECPSTFAGTVTVNVDMGSKFLNTITTGNNAVVTILNSTFSTGATTAITHNSANALTLSHVTIDCTNATVISGTGVGNLNLGTLDFLNNTTLASTLTVIDKPTLNTPMHAWNGSILETQNIIVTSDGAIITFSIEKSGGGNLTLVTSKGFFDYVTAPDTITLTAGSDSSPQLNFIYWLESTRTLTVNTSNFPSTEHIPLATVLCQSATSLQTDGAYKVHVWTDHVTSDNNQGHVSHLNSWIRNQNARWIDGVNQTFTITPQGGAPDNVILSTASGTVLQLHDHIYPAFSPSIDYYVINDSVVPYNIVNDLNALLLDSTGASMSGKFFTLVIWGVVSEDSSESKIFVNLPSGFYNNATSVTVDALKFANFSIPSEFVGTAFLIAQWNLRHQPAAGGTWTSIDEVDLRGLFPGISAGAGTVAGSEFIDNAFRILDEGDNTKEVAFEVSGITTATTRTLTVPDADGIIALTSDAVVVQQERTQFSTYVSTAATIPFDNTIPQNTEGAALTSINFTPTNVNNILVFEFAGIATANGVNAVTFSLFEAAGVNAIHAFSDTTSSSNHMITPNFKFNKVAGTVALTNYALRWGGSAALTVFLNGNTTIALYGGVATASFTITEYKV